VLGVEGTGEATPPDVPGEDGLLITGGRAAFRFDLLQEPDGGEVPLDLLVGRALADPVGVG